MAPGSCERVAGEPDGGATMSRRFEWLVSFLAVACADTNRFIVPERPVSAASGVLLPGRDTRHRPECLPLPRNVFAHRFDALAMPI